MIFNDTSLATRSSSGSRESKRWLGTHSAAAATAGASNSRGVREDRDRACLVIVDVYIYI
jgi:hypothetical protein